MSVHSDISIISASHSFFFCFFYRPKFIGASFHIQQVDINYQAGLFMQQIAKQGSNGPVTLQHLLQYLFTHRDEYRPGCTSLDINLKKC